MQRISTRRVRRRANAFNAESNWVPTDPKRQFELLFRLYGPTKAFSDKVKKGRVISQKPRPGKKLAVGSKVKLKVSRGKKKS